MSQAFACPTIEYISNPLTRLRRKRKAYYCGFRYHPMSDRFSILVRPIGVLGVEGVWLDSEYIIDMEELVQHFCAKYPELAYQIFGVK